MSEPILNQLIAATHGLPKREAIRLRHICSLILDEHKPEEARDALCYLRGITEAKGASPVPKAIP